MNWKKIYTQQVDESDCGVAALSMILKYFGSYIPLATLRYHGNHNHRENPRHNQGRNHSRRED